MAKFDRLNPGLSKKSEVDKGLQKRQSIKQMSVVKRYSSINDVVVGLAERPKKKSEFQEVLEDIEKRDKEVFRGFVSAYLAKRMINDPYVEAKILKDTELKKAVLLFLKLDSKFSPATRAVKKKLAKGIVDRMVSYFPKMKEIDKEENDQFFFNYLFVKHIEQFRDLILKTDNKKAIKIWQDGIEALKKDGETGEVKTSKQFIERLTKVFNDAIAATGDKELQEMWASYEESGVKGAVEFVVSDVEDPEDKKKKKEEKPVKKKEEKDKAIKKVSTKVNGVTGFEMAQDSAGNAKVVIDGDFEVEMSVYIDENNQYVYSITDEYIGEPLRVGADGLLKALYTRQIDGLISRQLLEHPDFVGEVAGIKDKEMVKLVKKVVGEGKDKNFELGKEDREVIKALVGVLKGKDNKYLSLSKRIEALNESLNAKQKGDYARRLLLESADGVENVSALIELVK
jgi:hypothetical protein